MKCIEFTNEKKYIKDFLSLPKNLYSRDDNMENPKEVEKLLLGNHPVSSYVTLHKFVIYKENKPAARFVITVYPNTSEAYLGFYECINDDKVAAFLFENAINYAKKIGVAKITGPVDASFWMKYRMKINMFDRLPYTSEPYNKDYYLKQWQDNGFKISEHYTSNLYEVLEVNESLYDNRYAAFKEKGYDIISPKPEDFDKVVSELYKLITKLYSDFPVYKNIKYDDFMQIFTDYRYIINMNMVKMAYYKNEAVGFFVSVPDYGNKVYHLNNPINLLKVLQTKKKPKRYVMLYMGVDSAHTGLGKALAGSIMEELRKNKLPSIGALARDGKVTQKYGENHIEKQYEYVLLEANLT